MSVCEQCDGTGKTPIGMIQYGTCGLCKGGTEPPADVITERDHEAVARFLVWLADTPDNVEHPERKALNEKLATRYREHAPPGTEIK